MSDVNTQQTSNKVISKFSLFDWHVFKRCLDKVKYFILCNLVIIKIDLNFDLPPTSITQNKNLAKNWTVKDFVP